MFARRVLGAVAFLLVVGPAGRAETYPLAETVQVGDCFQVQLDMKLKGELRIHKEGQAVPLKLEATAQHAFPERVLAAGAGGIEKTARVYETAKVLISAGPDRSERTLRPERRLVVAQRHKDRLLVYSPAGAFFGPELELTAGHFNTLALPGLLPNKAVAVGETWKVPSGVVQALCNFEGLTEGELTGKLDGVQGDTATLSFTGSAGGIDQGALVKVTAIRATGRYDLKARRLVGLEWTQKDERGQGPVSPATAVEATTTVSRKAIDQPAKLSDVELISVPSDPTPPAPMLFLDYRDPKGRFSLLHPREWLLTGETNEHLVLRLMDRGDFIAQVTLTLWTPAKKGEHLSAEDFKNAMNDTSGWKPEKEYQSGEVPSEGGRWVYRYSVLGQLEGVTVLQNFYLVAAPGGEQIVLVFTMTPKQADKLGARDLSLVQSLEIPAAARK